MTTYNIPVENMPKLVKKIATITKKANSVGANVTFTVGKTSTVKRNGVYRKVVEVEANGEYKIEGWTLIAEIEHRFNGNVIRCVCPVEVPSEYYTAAPVCDHCGTNRNRINTYLVVNEDGEIKQVGKSCLAGYTHGLSAEFAAFICHFFNDEMHKFEEDFEDGVRYSNFYETRMYAAYCAAVIKKLGYAKRGGDSDICTADIARNMMYLKVKPELLLPAEVNEINNLVESKGIKVDDSCYEAVDNCIEYWMGRTSDNCYTNNVKVVLGEEAIEAKDFGLVASAVWCFMKAALEASVAKSKSNEWIGEIGDKVSFKPAKTWCSGGYENGYGKYVCYICFEDEEGNKYEWKTSVDVDLECEILSVTGKVKDHTEYNGRKSTVLTRCKVVYK